VTTVLRLGYLFEERVLRPAVVVVTGPEHESEGAGDAAASDAGASGDAAAPEAGGSDGAAKAAGSDAGVSDAGASEPGASGGETADAAK
jgi:hypothetical protein